MSHPKRKILVIEDSPVAQEIIKKFLEKNGYGVLSAWDGREGVEMAKGESPDAILMDVILPDGDGKKIAARLKENPETKKIPIIFTTSTVNFKDDKGFEAFEIDGVLYRAFAKPLHQQRVLSTLRKEINRSKAGGRLPSQIKTYLKFKSSP